MLIATDDSEATAAAAATRVEETVAEERDIMLSAFLAFPRNDLHYARFIGIFYICNIIFDYRNRNDNMEFIVLFGVRKALFPYSMRI